jgi:hypothetical protein
MSYTYGSNAQDGAYHGRLSPVVEAPEADSLPSAPRSVPSEADLQEDGGWDDLYPFDPEAEQAKDDAFIDDDMPLEALLEIELPPPQLNLPGVPIAPSAAEVQQHNATHCNGTGPAPWCKRCIAGKGRDDGNSQPARDAELGEKIVELAYQFYSREGALVEGEARLATVLNAICTSTTSRFACHVRHIRQIHCRLVRRISTPISAPLCNLGI